jgi:hypothetical protein
MANESPTWVKVFWMAVLLGVVAFAIVHLAGRGPRQHGAHGPSTVST